MTQKAILRCELSKTSMWGPEIAFEKEVNLAFTPANDMVFHDGDLTLVVSYILYDIKKEQLFISFSKTYPEQQEVKSYFDLVDLFKKEGWEKV